MTVFETSAILMGSWWKKRGEKENATCTLPTNLVVILDYRSLLHVACHAWFRYYYCVLECEVYVYIALLHNLMISCELWIHCMMQVFLLIIALLLVHWLILQVPLRRQIVKWIMRSLNRWKPTVHYVADWWWKNKVQLDQTISVLWGISEIVNSADRNSCYLS